MTNTSSGERKLPVGREHIECHSCSRPGPQMRCSRCQIVYYCNKACQRAHWSSSHKEECSHFCSLKEQHLGFAKMGSPPEIPPATNTECSICFSEPIVNPFTFPTCSHSFCYSCIHQWQQSASDKKCPVCRKETPNVFVETQGRIVYHRCRAENRSTSEIEKRRHNQLALAENEKLLHSASELSPEELKHKILKAKILLDLEEYGQALEICQELEATYQEGDDRYFGLLNHLSKRDYARKDMSEYMKLNRKVKEKRAPFAFKPKAHMKIFKIFDLMGQCQEGLGEYVEAMNTYKKAMNTIFVYTLDHDDDLETWAILLHKNPDLGSTQEWFEITMNFCRCLYYQGNYESSIEYGERLVKMNRNFPEVHKYLALSQKASGNLDAAIRTMGRAIHYEEPWDKSLKAMNLRVYEEFKEAASPST